ncbi:MAG TPA: hypothetical protein VFG72_10285 [Marmoricola sp.]|nr:hypothetical protein [Marmoricola sp.]
MRSRLVRLALGIVACVITASVVPAADALPPTELVGGGKVIPLKNAAMITKTNVGYRYRAGQQDSHLVVTKVGRRLHFKDSGTARLRSLPGSCREQRAAKGIAASCRVPAKYGVSRPMFVEVWPRLGDDYVNGSTLSAAFRLWALVDAGRDTVYGGAGADFVNGAHDADKVRGGAGNDWIRTGNGRDTVRGDAGADKIACGDGADNAWLDRADRHSKCEAARRG